MGILNVTPDSFSDGGTFLSTEAALKRAGEMLEEGAVIIDVGGASSRPRGSVYGEGAAALTAVEEWDRIGAVISELANRYSEAIISVDTYHPLVAERAMKAGAHIINDITGLRLFPEIADIASDAGAPLVVMHSVGKPGDMPHVEEQADVVERVRSSLARSIDTATAAGVRDIVVDPGFGFGKSVGDNLRLINNLAVFAGLGRPVLIGISRKSTIGIVLGSPDEPAPVAARLYGTLGATAVAVLRGASIVRTHDVAPTVQMLTVIRETLTVAEA